MANAAPHNGRENRLAAETSPYLLQHKTNPVDWWPWGPPALAEAKQSGKPILLSVGYAACHWCHVMAHESFEDQATAEVMNALFVNIKVDREERPDIDQIYMNALHLLGEQGGWPLTMFLTSAGEPFWGGTYFPNEAKFGRPAFVDVLREVSRVYAQEPQKIAQNRDALLQRLAARAEAESAVNIGSNELNNIAASIAQATDPVHGGLRGAPKFPQCSMLEFMWRAGARTNDARFFAATDLALTQMSLGGIYDHIGGGYARYSVDERWLVPHFEKMLYDNAQILDLLALDFSRIQNPLWQQRAEETIGWLTREMVLGEGGFASSLDADSEGEEGKFYVWSLAEVAQVLGIDDVGFFAAKYDISRAGNFEGHNIPNRLNGLDDTPEEAARLAMLRQKLHNERSKRVRPGLDDKILADWNGLMIAALTNAAVAFDQPAWRELAAKAFDFIASKMSRGDRLGHSWRDGKRLLPGLASDLAARIRAALALHETTGEARYLDQALRWQTALDTHYADRELGGYYLTADDAEGLIIRPHSTIDDAIPNHNGLIAQNLVRLAVMTGDTQWSARADAMFDAILPRAKENLFGHLSLLSALDMRINAAEIVVVGQGALADALLGVARKLPHATRIVLHATEASALAAEHPAQAKLASVSGAAAFVCRGQACSLPVATGEELVGLVRTPQS